MGSFVHLNRIVIQYMLYQTDKFSSPITKMLVIYNSEGTLFSSDTYYTYIFFLFNLRDIHSMLYNFIFFKTDTIFSVLPVTIMIQCFQCGVQNNSVSIFLICVIPAYTFHMVSHYIFNKDCFHCVHCSRIITYYILILGQHC